MATPLYAITSEDVSLSIKYTAVSTRLDITAIVSCDTETRFDAEALPSLIAKSRFAERGKELAEIKLWL